MKQKKEYLDVTKELLGEKIKLGKVMLVRQMIKIVIANHFREDMKTIAESIVDALQGMDARIRAFDKTQYGIEVHPIEEYPKYTITFSLRGEQLADLIEVITIGGEKYYVGMFYDDPDCLWDESGKRQTFFGTKLALEVLSDSVKTMLN